MGIDCLLNNVKPGIQDVAKTNLKTKRRSGEINCTYCGQYLALSFQNIQGDSYENGFIPLNREVLGEINKCGSTQFTKIIHFYV